MITCYLNNEKSWNGKMYSYWNGPRIPMLCNKSSQDVFIRVKFHHSAPQQCTTELYIYTSASQRYFKQPQEFVYDTIIPHPYSRSRYYDLNDKMRYTSSH